MAISDLTGAASNYIGALDSAIALKQQRAPGNLISALGSGMKGMYDQSKEEEDKAKVVQMLKANGFSDEEAAGLVQMGPKAAGQAIIDKQKEKAARAQKVEDRDIENRGKGLSPSGEYLGPDQDPGVQSANAVGESALDRAMRLKKDEREYAEGQDAIVGAEAQDLTRPGVGLTGPMNPMVPFSGIGSAPATPSLVDKRVHAEGAPTYRTASIDRAMKYTGALQPPTTKPLSELDRANADRARAEADKFRADAGRGPTPRNADPNSEDVLRRKAEIQKEVDEHAATVRAALKDPAVPEELKAEAEMAKKEFDSVAEMAGIMVATDPNAMNSAQMQAARTKYLAVKKKIDQYKSSSRPKLGKSRESENAQEDAAEGGMEEDPGYAAWAGENVPPGDTGADYDYRGAYAAGEARSKDASGRGHLTDAFKRPNHPTFSKGSKEAAKYPDLAGTFDGEKYTETPAHAYLMTLDPESQKEFLALTPEGRKAAMQALGK